MAKRKPTVLSQQIKAVTDIIEDLLYYGAPTRAVKYTLEAFFGDDLDVELDELPSEEEVRDEIVKLGFPLAEDYEDD